MLGLAILIAGLWVFSTAAKTRPFHRDESRSILASRYFGYLFLERDLARPEWGDGPQTHGQPMLMRYLIGGRLWAGGYDLDALPSPYDSDKSLQENRREGRVPDATLLAAARAPMVALAAGAVTLLYLLGRVLGGVAAGLAAATLALGSPFSQTYLVRAKQEAPLVFFLMLTLLVGVLGIRRGREGGLPTGWAVALGVALGLGLA